MPPISSVQEIEKSNDKKNNKSQNNKIVNDDTDATSSKKPILKQPTKPDEEAHKASIEEINMNIDKLREQQVSINEKYANFSNNDSNAQKREELNAQLDKLRGRQSEIKKVRTKTFEQIKLMNDSLQKKKQDLKNAKSKLKFKSIEDIDAEIMNSERLIESGNITLVDEKKLVLEISSLKRSRKIVESLSTQQMSIDTDQKAIDEMKRSLEHSNFKETNEKYDEVKSQLDVINKDQAVYKEKRGELNDEKKRIKNLMDMEYSKRKSLLDEYYKAKQEYFNWQSEERRRRNEFQRQKKEQFEREKIEKETEDKLEQASIPAFREHIITCDTLINYFKTTYGIIKTTTEDITSTNSDNLIINDNSKQSLEPESEINIRKPDSVSNVPEGTILVSKANRDDDYFTGSSKSSKKKSKDKKSNNSSRQNSSFQLPISILEELNLVQVMVPLKIIDVEKVIDDLIEKKKYYTENQDLVTKQNILKAEAEIAVLIHNIGNNRKKNQKKNDYNNNNNNKSFSNEDDNNYVVANDDVDGTKNKTIDSINNDDQKINDLSTKAEIYTASSVDATTTTAITTISSPLTTTTTTTTTTAIAVENKN